MQFYYPHEGGAGRGIESSAVPHPAPRSPHFRGRVAKARFRGGHETKQVAWNRAIPKCARGNPRYHFPIVIRRDVGREGIGGGAPGRPIKRANTVPPTIDTLRKDGDFWNCSRFHSRQFRTAEPGHQLPVAFRHLPPTHQFE